MIKIRISQLMRVYNIRNLVKRGLEISMDLSSLTAFRVHVLTAPSQHGIVSHRISQFASIDENDTTSQVNKGHSDFFTPLNMRLIETCNQAYQ